MCSVCSQHGLKQSTKSKVCICITLDNNSISNATVTRSTQLPKIQTVSWTPQVPQLSMLFSFCMSIFTGFVLILVNISLPPFPRDTVSLSSLQWPLQAYALDLEEQVSQTTLKIDKSQPSLRGFVSSSVLGMVMETEVSIDLADREAFGFFGHSHLFLHDTAPVPYFLKRGLPLELEFTADWAKLGGQ